MKKLVYLICLPILLFSCGDEQEVITKSLSGTIRNLSTNTPIYLDYIAPNQLTTKDTSYLNENGDYFFTHQIEALGYYRLRLNNQNFINLILQPNDKPVINADGLNLMDTYSIIGSEESNKLKDFQLVYKVNSLKQDSINALYKANPNDAQLFIELQKANFMATNEMNTALTGIINKNPGSLVSLQAVQQLELESNRDLYVKVDEALQKKLSNNPWVMDFHDKVKGIIAISTGKPVPDFTLPTIDGKSFTLSSLRGKVVLVDFWASWCRPCRAENPTVVKAYQTYHNKGFEVVSVSLDGMPQQQDPKKDWLTAIKKDGLVWKNHVSELKGWNSNVVSIFGIQGIPFTILIDKEGIILSVNIRGEALEDRLVEIFKE